MAAGVKEIDSVEDFNKLLADAAGNLVVVHFAAPWAPQCKQMTDVMSVLSQDNELKQVFFVQVEAEKLAEISEKNNIIAVPTFIFFKGGKSVDRLDGANAADLTKKVRGLSSGTMVASPPPQTQKQDLNTRLKQLINSAPVMLFMKGSPEEPKCGFSRQMISILNEKNVSYSTFDILQDEEVRQGLKTYSNWPTYPQLYAKGELLGGLDIVKELAESGELESQLPAKVKLEDRFPGTNSVHTSALISPHSVSCDTGDLHKPLLGNPAHGAPETRHASLSDTQTCIEVGGLNIGGFTVTVNESEEDIGDDEDLPLWFGGDSCETSQNVMGSVASKDSEMCQKRETKRVKQMMLRRRDTMILNMAVDPNMPIQNANKLWLELQREAGVSVEDITTLLIGNERFGTIGELKRKIEVKRALDRERKRKKRAQLDESLSEAIKRNCRERMREKRARLDPAAAAAYREREKIRKRIARRRNAMLLSIPNESITPNTGVDGYENTSGQPVPPEVSSALLILRENLLRKRVEENARLRQRRADLREKHPEVAAAIRERERLRKRITRRRNSLLLNLGPDALLKATQAMMSQDSQSSSESTQTLLDCPSSALSEQTDRSQESQNIANLSASSADCSFSLNSDSSSVGDNHQDLSANIEKLVQSAQRKKDYNKERMRLKRAKLKENPEAFEAMKERERLRKQMERLKKKGVTVDDEPLTFSYDAPPDSSSIVNPGEVDETNEKEETNPVSEDGLPVKQEPLDKDSDSMTSCSTVNKTLIPPQDINKMKANYSSINADHENDLMSKTCVVTSNDKLSAAEQSVADSFVKLESEFDPGTKNSDSLGKLKDYSKHFNQARCLQTPCSVNSDNQNVSAVQNSRLFNGKAGQTVDSYQEYHGSETRLKGHIDNSVDVPAFTSVEEERDWFQSQLCQLQTRVLDTDSQIISQHSATAGPPGLCNTNVPPVDSPGLSSHTYNNSIGSFSVNPFSDIAKLTASSAQPAPSSDYLSGIAEVTLRSSLEQITALAGPEVMQDRLCEMVQSAKQAREKANEQARKRREKLRKDPAMRQKYEEIKARDMERKRQQRAKEAEIRTVFPAYNEEKRIRDRERKKWIRSRMKEGGVGDSNGRNTKSYPGHDSQGGLNCNSPMSAMSQFLGQNMAMSQLSPFPRPSLHIDGANQCQSFLSPVYAHSAASSGGAASASANLQNYIPQFQESQIRLRDNPNEIKPCLSQNHRLAS